MVNRCSPDLVAAECFAGIGLVRLGLERSGFRVAWSNDWEPAKHDLAWLVSDEAKFITGIALPLDAGFTIR